MSEDMETQSSNPCNCDAKLADIVAALEGLQEKTSAHTAAVNSFGQMLQGIVDMVSNTVQKFSSGFNPMSLIKGLTGGKGENVG